nr:MAG: hypothetical protein [Bacteriophage sp.]
MAKDKKLHPNTQRLQSLIAEYGVDAVLEATGYTLSTLTLYSRQGGTVIPTVRLEIAIKVLTK